MVNDIVIVADLGAAGNLIRNLTLLSEQVDWPLTADRVATIFNQYNPDNNLNQWLPTEYRLRFWNKYYNVDISDDIDLLKFSQRRIAAKPVVYLNHSAFYQSDRYQQLKNMVKTLYVAPVTDFGLKWQIRSYCEKKTVEQLHNFTFDTDVEAQRNNYCRIHGVDTYYRLNIKNFTEIVNSRQTKFGSPDLPLESLLFGDTAQVVDILLKKLDISVDKELANQILIKWQQCHWPLEQTTNWKYYDSNA